MKKLSLVVMALFAYNAHAGISADDIAKEEPVISYSGLNYPQPLQAEDSKPLKMDQLLSNKITQNADGSKKTDVSELRKDALVEIAYALGSSGGLVSRMKEIKAEIDKQSVELDQVFNFSKMQIDNGVIAPVLQEGLSNYAQDNPDQVRIADKIYTIEEPAKFVSVIPTWRNYLRFAFPSYETPNSAYLPKNDAEKAIWDKTIKEGWAKGVNQANTIFEASYSRLDRDYKGMIKYKLLLAEGLITPTIIAKQNLGVTGGGRSMSINDQVFRITDHSALNPNQQNWKVEYPITNNVDGTLK